MDKPALRVLGTEIGSLLRAQEPLAYLLQGGGLSGPKPCLGLNETVAPDLTDSPRPE